MSKFSTGTLRKRKAPRKKANSKKAPRKKAPRKKTQKKNNSTARGILSRMRKTITNRFRRPTTMVQYSQTVLDQKLLDTALYGYPPAEVRKLISFGANPNATMYDYKVGKERSVIQIAHSNRYDYIVNILREHGVTEPLSPRMSKTFSLTSSMKPMSRTRKKTSKSVRFGSHSMRSIPRIGVRKTPSRMSYVSATNDDMSRARREQLEYSLQRARLEELRGKQYHTL